MTSHSPFLINYIKPDNLYIKFQTKIMKLHLGNLNKIVLITTEQSRANSMMVVSMFWFDETTEEDFEELCRYLEND